MKACVLHAINNLRYEEVATPTVKSGEVLLKIRASSICGSDIQRVFEKGTYHFPTIVGHEFAGEIVSVAKDVDKSLIGKKAAVFPLLPCGKCEFCEVGEYAQCKDYNYFGSRCDGGFAEYLAVPAWNLVLVPDSLSFEEAAMCEPASVALHALSQVGINFGDNVAIFGASTIGLMLASWSKAWGADKVFLIDIDQKKLNFAVSLGFDQVINSLEEDVIAKINAQTKSKGADVVIEGTGVSIALENCLKVARTFGKIVLMGNPTGDMKLSQKAYWEILRKQLMIKGTWNSSYNGIKNDWEKSVSAMSSGKLNLKPLITHRFNFSDCNKAFNILKEKKEMAVKVMFINDK
jgi:L-iditol 2-dehydrogenase